jgi:hypothetical protein
VSFESFFRASELTWNSDEQGTVAAVVAGAKEIITEKDYEGFIYSRCVKQQKGMEVHFQQEQTSHLRTNYIDCGPTLPSYQTY